MKKPGQVIIVPIKDKGDGECSGPSKTLCTGAFAGPGIKVFAEAGGIDRYPIEKVGAHFIGQFAVAIFPQALSRRLRTGRD